MILVDTSVWIGHLRESTPALVELLNDGAVLTHPFVIEELACGNLAHRKEILDLLSALPSAPVAEHDELLGFISSQRLSGSGLGAIDVHLLASTRLAHAKLWSADKSLDRAAKKLDLAAAL